MEPKAEKPCFRRLEDQTKERKALYSQIQSPGENIPNNVDRIPSDDKAPPDEELRHSTKRGGNNKSVSVSGIRIKDLKNWSMGAEQEERWRRRGARGA